jgi:phospholipase D1/2
MQQGYLPKVKTGHVAPGVSLDVVKDRLSRVRGALVEMPLDFLIDQNDFVNNSSFNGYNPTLPIYI